MSNFLHRIIARLQKWFYDAATPHDDLAFNPVPAYLPF